MTKNKLDKIFRKFNEEVESANYHDLYGILESIHKKIDKLIPEENQIKVIRAISEVITSKI